MLDHLVGLLVRVLNSQLTGAKPLQVHVDLADGHKDDRYHEYGCVLSARFTVDALKTLLN
jgi:hypothetical protein